MSTRILVVDDDEAILTVLMLRLEQWGYEVKGAQTGLDAEGLALSFQPDLVISDVVMPEMSGIDLLKALKQGAPKRPVVLVTAHGSVDMAVEAMKQGAQDFLTKPIDYAKLRTVLQTAEEEIQLRASSERLASMIADGSGFRGLVGMSSQMQRVYQQIRDFGRTDASVLITGESGTGKELVARAIHEESRRKDGPFIAVNTSAIPDQLMESEIFGHEKGAFTGAVTTRPGCFELADNGTLFLDEIGEMPMLLQPKLLRVLEDGRVRRLGARQEFQVDVRVLSATNRKPKEAIESRNLREDLYYRLNVFTIELPPLRHRREDIPLLVEAFIAELNHKHNTEVEGVREEAIVLLTNYSWAGNVRELRNVIERAVVLAKQRWIEASHLPPYVQGTTVEVVGDRVTLPIGIPAAEAERILILKTLELVGGNKAEAARRLGLDVKTIRNKLKAYGQDE